MRSGSAAFERRLRRRNPGGCSKGAVEAPFDDLVPVPLHRLVERDRQVVAGGGEMRMDLERPTEHRCGFAVLAERQMAQALPGERAEMMRLPRERLATIGDGALVVAGEVADRRPLVPGFGESGGERDHPREAGLR